MPTQQIPVIQLPTETPNNAVSIPIIDVAWLDERPTCRHIIESWLAGQDTRNRCHNFGLPTNRPAQENYCPINGRICAMHDPNWIFKPGWSAFAQQVTRDKHIDMAAWPRFQPGDVVAYKVNGHCMEPTFLHTETVFAILDPTHNPHNTACVVQFQQHGLPVRGLHLKRLQPNGDSWLVTADNPNAGFEPIDIPKRALLIRAIALTGGAAEWVPRMPTVHIFNLRGEIIPITDHARSVKA
jgi:hypothetical protein